MLPAQQQLKELWFAGWYGSSLFSKQLPSEIRGDQKLVPANECWTSSGGHKYTLKGVLMYLEL